MTKQTSNSGGARKRARGGICLFLSLILIQFNILTNLLKNKRGSIHYDLHVPVTSFER